MKFLVAMTAVALLVGGCGSATLRPGRTMNGDLPPATHSLRTAWPGAVEALFGAGYPVRGSWYADDFSLKPGTAMGITISSHDFTPVIAVTDREGAILAVNDSWDDSGIARIILPEVPEGARLFVFSLGDRRGDYTLETRSLSPEELAREMGSADLESGRLTGWLPARRSYSEMATTLDGFFGDWIYAGDLQTARVHPFTVPGEGLVTLEVRDADFDALMVLASRTRDRYEYIAYEDDTIDMLPRISSYLMPGDYVAVVMAYSEGEGGPYTLTYDFLDTEGLETEVVNAADHGTEYRGEIVQGRNLAVSLWRESIDGIYYDTTLEPADPTGAFRFNVATPAICQLTASADFDICMTLLRETEFGLEYMNFNDDGMDIGTDSRISSMLPPGEYLALVHSYYEGDTGRVFFDWSTMDMDIPVLRPGQTREVYVSMDQTEAYLQFEIVPTQIYVITAEDDELDPTIEVFLPDGTSMFDDDSGGDLNSRLTIYPTELQAGTCILKVSEYWSDSDGNITVRLESDSLL